MADRSENENYDDTDHPCHSYKILRCCSLICIELFGLCHLVPQLTLRLHVYLMYYIH
jgi:hypothetical protein